MSRRGRSRCGHRRAPVDSVLLLPPVDLLSWLKTFSLSLTLISAAIDTLCQLGSSDDIKQTQVEQLVWPPSRGHP